MDRRSFLQNSGAALGGLVLAPHLAGAQALFPVKGRPIGLQLFTLMGIIDQDVTGTLKKVADLGFNELESAYSLKGGYYGMKPKEFAAMVKGLGMAWRSHHVLGTPFIPPPDMKVPLDLPKMRTLKDNHQELVDEVAEGGIQYLVCAAIDIATPDAVKSSIDILNRTGEACKKAGVTLAYHNHDAEFGKVDGQVIYEKFLNELMPEIKMELDLAWVTKAGVDPVQLFKQHKGRFPLWHVKDFDKDFKTLLPVGQGVVDFKRIFDHAKTAGLQHCFVEHDMPPNAWESITSSIAYLKGILK